MGLSVPARERLLLLMRLFEKHVYNGENGAISSAQAEKLTGLPRDTIRKDISFLRGSIGCASGLLSLQEHDLENRADSAFGGCAGYEPETLIPLIKKALGLEKRRKFCVIGLGRLGSAYLNFAPADTAEFELAAGFDSNFNRVEILKAAVPLYPAHKLGEVISRFNIEIALLCVPMEAAQSAAEKCVAAGIRGILNFAPAALILPPEITVRNVYLADELRALVIKME